VNFFGRHQRESFVQGKPGLRSENGEGAGAGAIAAPDAIFENKLKKVVVLPHVFNIRRRKEHSLNLKRERVQGRFHWRKNEKAGRHAEVKG
jgi:hypothetical protein